jgi:hypothetical protein
MDMYPNYLQTLYFKMALNKSRIQGDTGEQSTKENRLRQRLL